MPNAITPNSNFPQGMPRMPNPGNTNPGMMPQPIRSGNIISSTHSQEIIDSAAQSPAQMAMMNQNTMRNMPPTISPNIPPPVYQNYGGNKQQANYIPNAQHFAGREFHPSIYNNIPPSMNMNVNAPVNPAGNMGNMNMQRMHFQIKNMGNMPPQMNNMMDMMKKK